MGAREALFGRGDVVDRAAADQPWAFGAVGLAAMLVLLIGLGLLVADAVNWAITLGFALIFAATMVAIGFQRRRRLARGLR